MKVVFIANDGTVFSDVAECVKHETECETDKVSIKDYLPLAWHRDGCPLKEGDCYDSAMFVYLEPVEAFNNAQRFMNWVIDTGGDRDDYAGIDEECEGLFYWDEWDCKYVWADFDVIDVLTKLNKIIKGKA